MPTNVRDFLRIFMPSFSFFVTLVTRETLERRRTNLVTCEAFELLGKNKTFPIFSVLYYMFYVSFKSTQNWLVLLDIENTFLAALVRTSDL